MMPSGCEKCPQCGEETLQPFKNRASCLRVADCGYSERREDDTKDALRAQVARLEGEKAALAAALRIIEERTTHLPGWVAADSAADVFLGELWAVAHKARAALSDAGKQPCPNCAAKDAALRQDAVCASCHCYFDICECKAGTEARAALSDTGEGWLPPEVREQAREAMQKMAPQFAVLRQTMAGPWLDCMEREFLDALAALDALRRE